MGVVLPFKRPDPDRQRADIVLDRGQKKPKHPDAVVAHLMTQRNQPYGSMRRCCEMCGRMIIGTNLEYTDNEKTYDNLVDDPSYIRCIDMPKEKR